MLDLNQIATTALEAFRAANYDYMRMSGGVWGVRYPIERYFSVKVAEGIWSKVLKDYTGAAVTLEEAVEYLQERATGAKVSREWLTRFGSRGFVDMAIWLDGDKPVGVVEVKRWPNNHADLLRLCILLDSRSFIDFGILIFAMDMPNRTGENDEETLSNLKRVIKDHFHWLSKRAKEKNLCLTFNCPIIDPPSFDNAYRQKYALGWAAALIQRNR